MCLLINTLDDHLIGSCLLVTGLISECRLAPRGYRRRHTDRALAFATAVRVIAGVHNNAADGRFDAHMTFSAGFTETYVFVLDVAYGTDGSFATERYISHFAGRHTKGRLVVLFSHKLCAYACGTSDLTTLAG